MFKNVISLFKDKNDKSLLVPEKHVVEMDYYRQLLLKDPNDVESRFKLARIYAENAETLMAINEYKVAAEISESEKNWDDAADIYSRLVEIEPDNLQWKRDLGFVLSEDERWDLAIAVYKQLEEADGGNPNVYYNLGRIYSEKGESDSAINYLKKSINLDPSHVQALTYLGTVYQDLHNYEESLVYFKKAIAIDSSFQYTYFNLAISYIALGDVAGAMKCFDTCSSILHGQPINERLANAISELPLGHAENVPGFKVLHDCEQFNYLAAVNDSPVMKEIAAAWTKTVDQLGLLELEKSHDFIDLGFTLGQGISPLVLKTMNKPVYIHRSNSVRHAINPDLDFELIQSRFLSADLKAMTIDNILTAEAWSSLLLFCQRNTFWYSIRKGYLGAFSHDGFYSELLFQIAIELRQRFPIIFKDNIWNNYWGFKHDRHHGGINVHADAAAINVNFWLTPDHANLNPESGGLLVWDKRPPPDWNFDKLNSDHVAINQFLAESGSKPVRFPYRANRALIFKSDLFHKTDEIEFDAGYENRRLNVTMLFGARDKPGKQIR
ncbi:MAG TPA: tetratricopeptide repeat protein [Pseudomonadales bacterium]|nr:tetratricopeptide repeat protein [Pseudomonadales bacterium]